MQQPYASQKGAGPTGSAADGPTLSERAFPGDAIPAGYVEAYGRCEPDVFWETPSCHDWRMRLSSLTRIETAGSKSAIKHYQYLTRQRTGITRHKMPVLHEFWDPNDWELHAFGLLQDRHGSTSVMKVPARHRGDFGIDYYCLSACVVYQCLAVQEPCDVADRADKQKVKITTDIKKFCTRSELMHLFAGRRIERWILVVPIHDSAQVNLHLTTKTTQVKALNLPYIAVDFEVLIHDLECFDPFSVEMRAAQRRQISLPPQPPTAKQVESWTEASNPLVTALSHKLSKRIGGDDPAQLAEAVEQAVGWFLERENALESLRRDVPQLHEALLGVISRHAAKLSLLGKPARGTAHDILRSEMDTLVAELKLSVPNFSEGSAHQIALGTIAEWLLRCPLDFPPYSHAA